MSGAVVALSVPEPERYMTRRQLADHMAVSVTTIDRWKRAGMPHETWGLRAVRFRPSLCIPWVRAQAWGVRGPFEGHSTPIRPTKEQA